MSIFKWSLIGLNSYFFLLLGIRYTKIKEPSFTYYSPIVGGGVIGFILFQEH